MRLILFFTSLEKTKEKLAELTTIRRLVEDQKKTNSEYEEYLARMASRIFLIRT